MSWKQHTCWQQAEMGPQQQDWALDWVFWVFWPQQHATWTGGC